MESTPKGIKLSVEHRPVRCNEVSGSPASQDDARSD
jgi:hypothetical protein